MTHTDILTAIYTHLQTDATLPQIAYANIQFDTTNLSFWLQVNIMPLPTKSLGYGAKKDIGGLIQITCIVKKDVGELACSRIADKVLQLFPIKSEITSGLKVDSEPYVSGGFTSETLYKMPVTVEYRLLQ